MNILQISKLIGAVVGTVLFIMGVGFLARIIYAPIEGTGPGYTLPVPEVAVVAEPAPAPAADTVQTASETTANAEETVTQAATDTATSETVTEVADTGASSGDGAGDASALSALLANASAEKGQRVARSCAACHAFTQDGRNKVGPVLYDIVGSPVARNETYKYSDAMRAKGANGDVWTFEALAAFLTNPRDYVPGTKMSFAGVRKEEDRMNLLAYLQTLSPSPVAF